MFQYNLGNPPYAAVNRIDENQLKFGFAGNSCISDKRMQKIAEIITKLLRIRFDLMKRF